MSRKESALWEERVQRKEPYEPNLEHQTNSISTVEQRLLFSLSLFTHLVSTHLESTALCEHHLGSPPNCFDSLAATKTVIHLARGRASS